MYEKLVIFFHGLKASGKTALINTLRDSEYEFDEGYAATSVANSVQMEKTLEASDGTKKELKIEIWDCGGIDRDSNKDRTQNVRKVRIFDADIIVHCVDLSNPLNVEEINRGLQEIQSRTPKKIILVGTKSDEAEQETLEQFHQFEKDERFIAVIVTSAKEDPNQQALWDAIIGKKPQKALEEEAITDENSAQPDNDASISWLVFSGFVAVLGVAAILLAVLALNLATFGTAGIVAASLGAAAFVGGCAGFGFFACQEKNQYVPVDEIVKEFETDLNV